MNEQEMVKLRQNFKLLLLQNPNYFGNLKAAAEVIKGFQPVMDMASETFFEELTCVSFNPHTDELGAVVRVKQAIGYDGGPCTDGSKEYVRFYLDYDGDGNWVDQGAVNFDAHNLPFGEELCYAVRLKVDPQKRTCCDATPVLPRVRAILSWNEEPEPDNPNWLPVWGNHRESNVQIAPRSPYLCLYVKNVFDKLGIAIDPSKLKTLTEALAIGEQPFALPTVALPILKEHYGAQVEETRFAYPLIHAMAKEPTHAALLEKATLLQAYGVDVAQFVEFLAATQFDTSYEEVKCVGLDRDLSTLHASVVIKRPCGYSGDLCQAGSLEYVAFYMDFGSGWEYVGTSSVRVHDIAEIPKDGLWYHVTQPVSLTEHQQAWCETGKARVRAILSWATPPTPNDPDYVASWGDWEECYVEIRPLPQGVPTGYMVPIIDAVGGMPVSMIDASGYANGENTAGLKAKDSPFDGKILIRGEIASAPDSSQVGMMRAQYRIWVKEPSQSDFQPYLHKFDIYVKTITAGVEGLQVKVTQTPAAPDGWIDYYPDPYSTPTSPVTVSVDEKLLGVFIPREEGLHELYVEIRDPNPTPALPVITNSDIITFMVDKQAPVMDIEITSGTGNCGVFEKGDLIEGTYSISDAHCHTMELSVTPTAEAQGAKPEVTSPAAAAGESTLVYDPLTGKLPGTGLAGTWELDTTNMKPCGYNVRIYGRERTIIDSRHNHRHRWDIEGFCLKAKEIKGGCC